MSNFSDVGENTSLCIKVKNVIKNRGKFRCAHFKNNGRDTIWSRTLGSVKREKMFTDQTCGDRNGFHGRGAQRINRRIIIGISKS